MKIQHQFKMGCLLGSLFLLFSCGEREETGGDSELSPQSTNIDSTNLYGTPPVRYDADDPADTTGRLPREDDTGRRANTEPRY